MALKSLKTRIAGFNHKDGAAQRLSGMRAGTRLLLVPEPCNPADPDAVQVVSRDGFVLGYVPAADCAKVGGYLRDRDVLVRAYKDGRTFNSITIDATAGDPLR